ncbi:MAG: hypothetical protein QOJ38_95 [Solirubrobacterales bacterium]|jgi:putative FmdB family regulatory protein|nr:hypothetical protein [Solirubrobacterales bacterium]
MPIYEYRCSNGHNFEVIQSMSDDPVETCQECEAPVQRVFHPVAVHFKGSGFYTTDYARSKGKPGEGGKGEGGGDSGGGEGDSGAKKSEGGSGDSGATKTEKKAETKSGKKAESKGSASAAAS